MNTFIHFALAISSRGEGVTNEAHQLHSLLDPSFAHSIEFPTKICDSAVHCTASAAAAASEACLNLDCFFFDFESQSQSEIIRSHSVSLPLQNSSRSRVASFSSRQSRNLAFIQLSGSIATSRTSAFKTLSAKGNFRDLGRN